MKKRMKKIVSAALCLTTALSLFGCKKNEITEDGEKDAHEQMQKITDKYIKEIDGIVAKKSKELSEV